MKALIIGLIFITGSLAYAENTYEKHGNCDGSSLSKNVTDCIDNLNRFANGTNFPPNGKLSNQKSIEVVEFEQRLSIASSNNCGISNNDKYNAIRQLVNSSVYTEDGNRKFCLEAIKQDISFSMLTIAAGAIYEKVLIEKACVNNAESYFNIQRVLDSLYLNGTDKMRMNAIKENIPARFRVNTASLTKEELNLYIIPAKLQANSPKTFSSANTSKVLNLLNEEITSLNKNMTAISKSKLSFVCNKAKLIPSQFIRKRSNGEGEFIADIEHKVIEPSKVIKGRTYKRVTDPVPQSAPGFNKAKGQGIQ